MSAEQNAVEGLSEGEQRIVGVAWFGAGCPEDMFAAVERIVADRVRLAVDEFAAGFPQ